MDENEKDITDESTESTAEALRESESEECTVEPETETEETPAARKPLPPVRKDKFFISALVLTVIGGVMAVLYVIYACAAANRQDISWVIYAVVGFLSNVMLLCVIVGLSLFGLFAVKRKGGEVKVMAFPILSLAMAVNCILSLICFMCIANIITVFLCLFSFILAISFGIAALTVYRGRLGKAGMGIAISGIIVDSLVLIVGFFTVATALAYM